MKKLLISVVLLIVGHTVSYSQTFPIKTNLSSRTTQTSVPGFLSTDNLFRVPRIDTVHSTAMLYPGAVTYSLTQNKLYVSNGTYWQLILDRPIYVTLPLTYSQDSLLVDTSSINGLATKTDVGGGLENFYFDKTNRYLGIQTQSPQSVLDISSTTSGVLIPRMTKAERDAMYEGLPPTGVMIYQTDLGNSGLRIFNGSNWVKFSETNDD